MFGEAQCLALGVSLSRSMEFLCRVLLNTECWYVWYKHWPHTPRDLLVILNLSLPLQLAQFQASYLLGHDCALKLQWTWGILAIKKHQNHQWMPRWWFQIFFIFTPIPGEMIQFDLRIFFKWVVQPPTRCVYIYMLYIYNGVHTFYSLSRLGFGGVWQKRQNDGFCWEVNSCWFTRVPGCPWWDHCKIRWDVQDILEALAHRREDGGGFCGLTFWTFKNISMISMSCRSWYKITMYQQCVKCFGTFATKNVTHLPPGSYLLRMHRCRKTGQ